MPSIGALLVSLTLVLTANTPAIAALPEGSDAPEFSVIGAQGEASVEVELSELLGDGPAVLFFFPSAFTEGGASNGFAEHIAAFSEAGASVVGMSRDTIDALAILSRDRYAGAFPLVSANENLVNAYDVNDGAMFNTRTTYVIAQSGEIVFAYDDQYAQDHAERALTFLRRSET